MLRRESTSSGGPPWWRDGDAWIKVYLVSSLFFVVGASALLALWPSLVEAGVNRIDDRWSRRLAYGEALVRSGQYEQAADYLENLDARFPAQSIKHRRDRERERLLSALAEAQEKSGRRKRSIRTLERLVNYDPNNIANHYMLGCALQRDGDDDAARRSFGNVLAISPYHLEATRAVMELDYESGRFGAVVDACSRFVDAVQFVQLSLEVGDQSLVIDAPTDGMVRDIRAPLNVEFGFQGPIRVRLRESEYYKRPVRLVIESAWGQSPLQFGQTPNAIRRVELIVSQTSENVFELSADPHRPQQAIASVHLSLGIAPVIDDETWGMIERSYRNALAFDELDAMQKRLQIQ